MKALDIAFTLWGGTIMLSCGFFAAMFGVNPYFLTGLVIGLFAVIPVTCPLLIPTTLFINLISKMSCSASTRLICLINHNK